MQKVRKNVGVSSENRAPRRHGIVTLPEVVDIDELGCMLDEDLVARFRALDDDRLRAYEAGHDVRPWEEELAYVRREQQIRRSRRDAHSDITRRLEEEFYRTEAGLPAGDFDNSSFVYAAQGVKARWN